MRNVYLFLLTIIVCASCTKNNDNSNPGEDLVLTSAEQQRVEADNKLTLKLLKKLAADPQEINLLFSPLSLSMAIAMTSNGSNGETLEGIRTAMEFTGASEQEVNSYYKKLINKLPVLDPQANVKIANSIWHRNSFIPEASFMQTNKDNYKAAIQTLAPSPSVAAQKINNWANTSTNGKIPKLIDGDVPSDIIMYLLNAVYFKANWKYRFDKKDTRKQVFHTALNGDVQADFMNIFAAFKMLHLPEVTVIELPYGNDKYSMVVLLPKPGKTVQDIANTADLEKWGTWTGNLQLWEQKMNISLPKFKYSNDIELNKVLISFGMGKAFSEQADFSRINPAGGLKISKVLQKTFIEVNEEGTEAAAVTAVGMQPTNSPGQLIIDRPFIFAIREMKTGLILFNGVVNNPLK